MAMDRATSQTDHQTTAITRSPLPDRRHCPAIAMLRAGSRRATRRPTYAPPRKAPADSHITRAPACPGDHQASAVRTARCARCQETANGRPGVH